MRALKALALRTLPPSTLFQLQKLYYVRQLRWFSKHNEPDVVILRRLVGVGEHVVDVGAHVGWYTKVLSEAVGLNGLVYSIEPIPSTFKILQYCVGRLKLTNVVARSCAISDADHKAAVMYVPRQADGYNFYQSSLEVDKPGERDLCFSVELRSLDSLFEGAHEDITFIKCDVEGHFLPAIKGASRLLRRCKPALMIEVSGDLDVPGTQGQQVFALLRDIGYSAWWYDGTRLHAYETGDRPVNHFFLTQSQLARLAGCRTVVAGQPDGSLRLSG
jgi:FkbM family methyltransferase